MVHEMTPPETLLYWIKERYAILQKKEQNLPPPWSEDPVFQKTYFTNVRREDDKVTRWIRTAYSPYVHHPLFEYNIVLARFLNKPESLEAIGGFCETHMPEVLASRLHQRSSLGYPIWGSAYVITTHGQKMGKLEYLEQVLNLTHEALSLVLRAIHKPENQCAETAKALQVIPGIGSFLAGQVVADLKNTVGHPLLYAKDRFSFVLPGPGSMRGASWFNYNTPVHASVPRFPAQFAAVRRYVDDNWPTDIPFIDNQDLQNCLCEFDKYMRVKNGTGRSKRTYNADKRTEHP